LYISIDLYFQPHLSNASALPDEIQKHGNRIFFTAQRYVSTVCAMAPSPSVRVYFIKTAKQHGYS